MIEIGKLDEIISKDKLSQPIYEVTCSGVREVEGYEFCYYFGGFANGYYFCWCGLENGLRIVTLDKLYLDKKEAEFVYKFFSKKTVEFHPPRWEEVQDGIECLKKSSADIDYIVVLQIFTKNNGLVELDFTKCEGSFQIELVNSEGNTIQTFGLIEDEYYKALTKAKCLFLGEEEEEV